MAHRSRVHFRPGIGVLGNLHSVNSGGTMRIVIGVMGPGERASKRDTDKAFILGRRIADHGWVLLSGGRDAGVMDAVNRGAKHAGGLTIGVLPGSDRRSGVSQHVDIAVMTGMGAARNNINVLSSDVVIACGTPAGGTLSEVALAVKAGRPVVLLTDDQEAKHFLERMSNGAVHPVATVDAAIDATKRLLPPPPAGE
jgi:uncharacterized protein (TIGR00725 family)